MAQWRHTKSLRRGHSRRVTRCQHIKATNAPSAHQRKRTLICISQLAIAHYPAIELIPAGGVGIPDLADVSQAARLQLLIFVALPA